MNFRSTFTLPSGRTAIAVAISPASSTNSQRQRSLVTATAAWEMTMISIVAQPMFCAMFSTVGATEPRRPNRPRRLAIAGAPVCEPNTAAPPRTRAPIPQPTTTASSPFSSDPVYAATRAPVTGPNSEIPRLPQRVNWSRKPSVRGASVVRTSGASVGVSDESRAAVVVMADLLPTPALPGQVQAVGDPARAARRPLSPPYRCELPRRFR